MYLVHVSHNPQHTESGLFVYTSDSHIRPWTKMAKDSKEAREKVSGFADTSELLTSPGAPPDICLCEIISCLNGMSYCC